jgi:leucyl aminopeptidase
MLRAGLVLADALHYTETRFKPEAMVNLATLTGAIIGSLGKEYGGLFANSDDLAKQLVAAGEATNEGLWQMPMGPAYDRMLKSHIADMKNIGGPYGGAITAACFLARFVEKTPWAHLDIAGKAWSDAATAIVPKGGTGYGVRLLNRLIDDWQGATILEQADEADGVKTKLMRQIDFYQIGQAGLEPVLLMLLKKTIAGKKEGLNPLSNASGKRP